MKDVTCFIEIQTKVAGIFNKDGSCSLTSIHFQHLFFSKTMSLMNIDIHLSYQGIEIHLSHQVQCHQQAQYVVDDIEPINNYDEFFCVFSTQTKMNNSLSHLHEHKRTTSCNLNASNKVAFQYIFSDILMLHKIRNTFETDFCSKLGSLCYNNNQS